MLVHFIFRFTVPCALTGLDFELPMLKFTELLVKTRSGTWIWAWAGRRCGRGGRGVSLCPSAAVHGEEVCALAHTVAIENM